MWLVSCQTVSSCLNWWFLARIMLQVRFGYMWLCYKTGHKHTIVLLDKINTILVLFASKYLTYTYKLQFRFWLSMILFNFIIMNYLFIIIIFFSITFIESDSVKTYTILQFISVFNFLFIRETWKTLSLLSQKYEAFQLVLTLIIIWNVSWTPNRHIEWFLKDHMPLKTWVMAAVLFILILPSQQ